MDMRKQVKSFFRYFITPRRWPGWLNPLALLVVCIFAIFLAILLGTPPFSAQGSSGLAAAQAITQTPVATAQTTLQAPVQPTNVPIPAEYAANGQQTIGITFAGTILVLIVVIGVIFYLPKQMDE